MDYRFPVLTGLMVALIILAVVWSGAWKGVALWRAARNGHLAWYVALCIVNTLGIMEIIYIFVIDRKKPQLKQPQA